MKYLFFFIAAMGSLPGVVAQPARTFRIGDTAFCGIVFHLDSSQRRGLVCALADQHAGIQWYNRSYITTKTTADYLFAKGSADTIIRVQKIGNYAATACN